MCFAAHNMKRNANRQSGQGCSHLPEKGDTMKEKTRDIISSLALIALSLFGLYLTFDIPEPFRDYDLGAAFLPRVVLGLIGGLAALKIAVAWMENRKGTVTLFDARQLLKGGGTILLVGLYCFCYKPVGFLLDTLIYLLLQILILVPKEKRKIWKIWKIVMIDMIATVVIYLIFSQGFSVRLPRGLITFL